MKIILQIHASIEVLAGFLLLFMPQLLLLQDNPDIGVIALSKLYGIIAFSFGMMSFVLSKTFSYTKMYKQIILIIMVFHLVIGLYMYSLYDQHITPHPGASVLHLILAVTFVFIYLMNLQKWEPS